MYSVNKYLVHPDMTYRRQVISGCQVGFPIRKSTDQSLFAAPHGLSQRTTSFIASYRQGIHQTPFSRLIRDSESMTCVMFTNLIISQRPGLGRDRTAWSVYLRLGKTVFCCMLLTRQGA